MKQLSIIAASFGLCVTLAAPAANVHNPALDVPIAIPGPLNDGFVSIAPQQSYTEIVPFQANLPHAPNIMTLAGKKVVGFSFAGVFVNDDNGQPNSNWWASDTKLTITLRNNAGAQVATYEVGGFWNVTNNWEFQGPGSSPSGFYTHGPDYNLKNENFLVPANPAGWKWEFTFEQDTFLTHAIWKGVAINLHIPTPGTLALLGVVALIGPRRRRG